MLKFPALAMSAAIAVSLLAMPVSPASARMRHPGFGFGLAAAGAALAVGAVALLTAPVAIITAPLRGPGYYPPPPAAYYPPPQAYYAPPPPAYYYAPAYPPGYYGQR